MSLETWGRIYDSLYGRTPVSELFFDPRNLVYLQSQLEQILKRLTQEEIRVPINEDFAQSMSNICSDNSWLAYAGLEGLSQLNEMFLETEARIQYVSLRHRKLYYKYFIDGNRMRVFPYGEGTKVVRGEVQISPSGYQLANPWRKQHGNYLHDVLGYGEHNTSCTRPYPHAVRT